MDQQAKPFTAESDTVDNILASGEHDCPFYSKSHFHHLLRVERQRTERSRKPFLLILLDISKAVNEPNPKEILNRIDSALKSTLRETDIRGWYDRNRVIGIILTEMTSMEAPLVEGIIRIIYGRLSQKLSRKLLDKIEISFHVFPEQKDDASSDVKFSNKLYPDLLKRDQNQQFSRTVKRLIDVSVSATLLLLLLPVFLVIAAAIKWTSNGPVFFRQDRLGYNGKGFTFLKFRSMSADNDPAAHRAYMKKFIAEQQSAAVEPGVFKLKDDLRVTPVGKWLRRTSLDELPQLINVLTGDMSLVGPRPPIPYECDLYDIWHRRRLLSCKPGITGLWQVTGRSRTTFDEMVRLDLKYINEWSLWLDLMILLKTPRAVLTGDGAY
ncbi:MAG: exopolysaccharide biosynthesis polyprenyl glycosylphosphotransferase [Syntrophaceae bacterium]|nr:exopolysaccharide biosynthesis polyprenyl glycosylphosphotransferase [Syntrophaceae bacterium]